MVLHYLWLVFFSIGMLATGYQYFSGHNPAIFELMVKNIFDTAHTGVTIAFGIIGIMTLFLGFMRIGEKAGAVQILSRLSYPFFVKLFPNIKKDEPVLGEMMMNFSANFLGLDNAATPFGLKAMQSLQKRNCTPQIASNEQIMFVALHASGLTLIPVTILAQRVILGSDNPTSVFIPTVITTYIATISVIVIVGIKQRINLLQPLLLGVLVGFSLLLGGALYFVPKSLLVSFSSVGGNLLILLVFFLFMLLAVRKKINIYETFISGAKEGFSTTVSLIPYLVGMLVMISIFRTSEALDLLLDGIRKVLAFLHLSGDYTEALPVAFMKPFSGSGARALMIDTMQTYGADSFIGQLSCIFQGSADTTLYITALYFGHIGVRNIRYTIKASLLADLISVISAIFIGYLFFK